MAEIMCNVDEGSTTVFVYEGVLKKAWLPQTWNDITIWDIKNVHGLSLWFVRYITQFLRSDNFPLELGYSILWFARVMLIEELSWAVYRSYRIVNVYKSQIFYVFLHILCFIKTTTTKKRAMKLLGHVCFSTWDIKWNY